MKKPHELTNAELRKYIEAHTDWYEEYASHGVEGQEEQEDVNHEVALLREAARRLTP